CARDYYGSGSSNW
nr:immunoglobulin heavy chain junction region [Macaca mulatta]MOV38627.1 immunoglobulin heavy chain junction region [Macaca mulatta]MOV39667.1 immunoglobulin heavy chain junction region [Macaca mulatta]MOV39867.1 immunoglobulin heavy chain junction region [Macaca mulatta]MOV41952.1 immunoglobulin heavy chain junction region [Macaca mulatta]